jgi:uncharacterized protein YkwD
VSDKVSIKFITAVLFIICIAAAARGMEKNTASRKPSASPVDPGRLEKKIHDLINKEREKRGLQTLEWDVNLHRIARKFSEDMARRDFFSHEDPEGRSFCDRYSAAGFSCSIRTGDTVCLGAENISQDNLVNSSSTEGGRTLLHYNTEDGIARSVVERWMHSKGHRLNILGPYFKREGIGVACDGGRKVYVSEDFC